MAYNLIVTPSAEEDLDGILTYIAKTLENHAAAADFLKKVLHCYDRLEATPLVYEQCRDPQLRARKYRRAVIGNYILIYRVDDTSKTVYILRFFYGGREYEKLI